MDYYMKTSGWSRAGNRLWCILLLYHAAALSGARAANYYVNSEHGLDTNSGMLVDKPWRSLDKVRSYGWSPGFRPGDTIFLAGACAQAGQDGALWFQLDRTYGTATHPVTITSLDPQNPAVITANGTHGIAIYSVPYPAPLGLGFVIKNLVLRSNGALGPGSKPTYGITVWHDSAVRLGALTIDTVTVSGFTKSGIATNRASQGTPFIQNVQVLNSVAFGNPGFAGLTGPSGNGIVLSGVQHALIQNCTAHSNGAMSTHEHGPVGIWAYDADRVIIRNCTSHDNLSKGNDGGGFDLDGGATNSVIEYCTSYNNYGAGYLFCSFPGYDIENVTIRHSSSTNDAHGLHLNNIRAPAAYVWPAYNSTITRASFYNMTINIPSSHCTLWTDNFTYPSALGVYSSPFIHAGKYSGVMWLNNTVKCAQHVITTSLQCTPTSFPDCAPL